MYSTLTVANPSTLPPRPSLAHNGAGGHTGAAVCADPPLASRHGYPWAEWTHHAGRGGSGGFVPVPHRRHRSQPIHPRDARRQQRAVRLCMLSRRAARHPLGTAGSTHQRVSWVRAGELGGLALSGVVGSPPAPSPARSALPPPRLRCAAALLGLLGCALVVRRRRRALGAPTTRLPLAGLHPCTGVSCSGLERRSGRGCGVGRRRTLLRSVRGRGPTGGGLLQLHPHWLGAHLVLGSLLSTLALLHLGGASDAPANARGRHALAGVPSLPVTLQGVKCKVRACERKYKL
jgi:hypothetical protein